MKIEHIALWVQDLETMKEFYEKYFGAVSNDQYHNQRKNFRSYFLDFGPGATRVELMSKPDIAPTEGHRGLHQGLAHFAVSVGGRAEVDSLTELLRKDGYTIYAEPRITGDGYYESVVLDPERNFVEVTI